MRKNKFSILIALALVAFVFCGVAQARDDKTLFTSNDPREIGTVAGVTDGGSTAEAGLVYTGACTVFGITVSGASAAAGDYAFIYDNTTDSGTPKFEVCIGTAKDTEIVDIPADGVSFDNGIYVKHSTGQVFTTIIYE